MKLKLYSVNNRYAFSVDKFSSMHHSFLCSGIRQTYPVAWKAYKDALKIAKSYHANAIKNKKYAAEDLAKPIAIDASAEEMLFDHYSAILSIISDKAEGFKKNTPDQNKIIYGEIKAIVGELLKIKDKLEKSKDKADLQSIVSKFKEIVSKKFPEFLAEDVKKKEEEEESATETPEAPATPEEIPQNPDQGQSAQQDPNMMPMPQANMSISRIEKFANMKYEQDFDLDEISKKEMMEEYGDRICSVMEKRHPGIICKINGGDIEIVESKNGSTIIKAKVNKNMNLENIIPCGELEDIFSLSSLEFYQRYWKPIVESVGHFFVKDSSSIIAAKKASLPDIPKTCPKSFNFSVWDTSNNKESKLCLSFMGEKNPIWQFEDCKEKMEKTASGQNSSQDKTTETKYTEEDFISGSPKRVMCIDPNLATIYKKIGEVVQVIPTENHIELDIDFGRQIIRLTGDQIEIVE